MPQATVPVDVIVPLHNGERFIERTLLSVLGQYLLPARLIIVDDGSTDAGTERVRLVRDRHAGPTEIILAHQANAGPNAARNHGLRLGDSAYVAFLDADDLWNPEKLAKQMQVFAGAGPDLLLVYCQGHWIDADDRITAGPPLKENPPLRGRVFERLLERNRITGSASAVLARRSAIEQAGGFDESLRTMEDFDMWLRISELGAIDLAEEDLVGIRTHEANNTKNAPHMLRGILRFVSKWHARGEHLPSVMHEWGHLIALFVMRCTDRQAAYAMVNERVTATQQRALFRKAGGSLRLYVLMKSIRRSFSSESVNA
ncbi:MAG: glycosyltransferase [Flavobacteriales bacterium]|nr:glycosyltransferase [Flavobacteriales bacterium]